MLIANFAFCIVYPCPSVAKVLILAKQLGRIEYGGKKDRNRGGD